MKSKQAPSSKFVPFTGELYPQSETTPPAANTAPYLIMVAAALVAGLAIGAISTYQNSSQVQLRQIKADAQQLEKVKTQVCR